MNIVEIESIISSKPQTVRELAERIFTISTNVGMLDLPDSMVAWADEQFSGAENLRKQSIVRIDNLITGHGVLYNSLRTMRPKTKIGTADELEKIIAEDALKPPFDKPAEMTPVDVFGRISGKHCVTASNVAKYDAWHGLVIFNEPHPLKWDEDQITDYLETAQKWFSAVYKEDKNAVYPLFQWNCLWRAASSIVHGHAQLSVAQGRPYSEVANLSCAAEAYLEEFDGADYFEDYYTLHYALGLAYELDGYRIVFPLDPKKEREIQIYGDAFSAGLAKPLYSILRAYRDTLGVMSFNLVGYLPPLKKSSDWGNVPMLFRLIDRGDLTSRNSEMGTMERFAQEVVVGDPFVTAASIFQK